MADIDVSVFSEGVEIERVSRPLRSLDGMPAITYRKRLWPVVNGRINIDELPPVPTGNSQEIGVVEVVLSTPLVPDAPPVFPAFPPPAHDDPLACEPHARILVDAGPGTGKTHIACARVAQLIEDGVPASRIWMISFTRTAVVEIRNRIAAALAEPMDAGSVKIATLDAHAWAIQSGFSNQAELTGDHEDNIRRTIELLTNDDDAAESLSRLEHLIIDEAQDIVEARAELVLQIIDRLDPLCGITVFADEAQAIYGFSETDSQANTALHLPDELRARGFAQLAMSEVHRTKDPRLSEIFTTVRQGLMHLQREQTDAHAYVRSEIARLAHVNLGKVVEIDLALLPATSLVLHRWRMDVLTHSTFSPAPHRLRMSGLPSCPFPWISMVLWDWTEGRLQRSEFEKRWTDRCAGEFGEDPSAPWSLLSETAGDGERVIELTRLRQMLSRSSPPMHLCAPDFGAFGPVLGTIHASKGREALDVVLVLPHQEGEIDGEESRVAFVGATRARERLSVGEARGRKGTTTSRKRAWRQTQRGGAQIEIGRPGDLFAEGLVGQAFFTDAEAVAAQAFWQANPRQGGLFAGPQASLGWLTELRDQEKNRVAVFSQALKSDMREIGTACKGRVSYLSHVRSMGLRTLAVAPNDAHAEQLLDPWRRSGFLLAPLISCLANALVAKKTP